MRYLLTWLLMFIVLPVKALTAEAYIVTDMNGKPLIEHNADETRSIASITKLFIAEKSMQLDQDELLMVTPGDVAHGRMRSTPLRAWQSYTRRQLIELALVSSDNIAAATLGRTLPDFVTDKATLVEATGLNPANQSTARNLADAARALFLTDIGRISTEKNAELGNRHSTNPLIDREGWKFYLSKTGFISASGGCLVVVFELNGKLATAVVLGARNVKERWNDLIELRRKLGDTGFYVPLQVVKRKRFKR